MREEGEELSIYSHSCFLKGRVGESLEEGRRQGDGTRSSYRKHERQVEGKWLTRMGLGYLGYLYLYTQVSAQDRHWAGEGAEVHREIKGEEARGTGLGTPSASPLGC